MAKINTHKDLRVFQTSFKSAMEIYHLSKSFPSEEKFSLTDQVRRSSRSVCANLAEAFRKRRYPKNFVSKLSDCEAEAAETQVWLDFALACSYISQEDYGKIYKEYDNIIGMLIKMIVEPEKWSV
jgi:four helix bundle protein